MIRGGCHDERDSQTERDERAQLRDPERPVELLERGMKRDDQLETEKRLEPGNYCARLLKSMLKFLVGRFLLNLFARDSSRACTIVLSPQAP